MSAFSRGLVAAAFAVMGFVSAPVQAAGGAATTVKVALLDMSSIAGPGMMGQGFRSGPMGQGYMGQGNMGRGMGPGVPSQGMMGQGAPGQGMMGPGWGWGGGTGPGWMAQGMMGPGMMGMGMMSVRTTSDRVKAGKVRFEVVNYSAAVVHELEVVAVDDLNAALPYDYGKAKVIVEKARNRGEVEDIAPGKEKVLELDLPAGNYLLVRNVPGHYAAGMVIPFVVTP